MWCFGFPPIGSPSTWFFLLYLDNKCFNAPANSLSNCYSDMICPVDVIAPCLPLDTVGRKVCSDLYLRSPNWYSIFGSSPFLVFCAFVLLLGMQSPVQSKCLFLSGPVYSPSELLAAAQCLHANHASGSSPWQSTPQPPAASVLQTGQL